MGRMRDDFLIIQNSDIYRGYRERLINLALSQFKWHGLPDTCDSMYFEKSLLFNGKACLCKPKGTDFWLSLDYIYKGRLDVYGYPTDIRGVGFGTNNLIEVDDWEIIFDNRDMTSIMPLIDYYAKQMWEVHQTYRSNLQQQINPYIVATKDTQKNSFLNFFNRFKGFQPVIYVDKHSEIDECIKTLDCHSDFHGTELTENLKFWWSEALSVLGITAETTKKERLIGDEIALNRMEDMISLNSRLMNRVELCNKMNAKYGWNLSVNLSSDEPNISDDLQFDYSSEVLEETTRSEYKSDEEKDKDRKEEE